MNSQNEIAGFVFSQLGILAEIVSFLPFYDRIHVIHTCRLFNDAAQQPVCWEVVDLQFCGDFKSSSIPIKLRPQIRHIVVACMAGRGLSDVMELFVEGEGYHSLECVEVYRLLDDGTIRNAIMPHSIQQHRSYHHFSTKHIKLEHHPVKKPMGPTAELRESSWPELRSLVIQLQFLTNDDCAYLKYKTPKLQELICLGGVGPLDFEILSVYLSSLHINLTVLALGELYFIHNSVASWGRIAPLVEILCESLAFIQIKNVDFSLTIMKHLLGTCGRTGCHTDWGTACVLLKQLGVL
eukprot:Platyproteum_vivax@DN1935_c0_g1_i1.p1